MLFFCGYLVSYDSDSSGYSCIVRNSFLSMVARGIKMNNKYQTQFHGLAEPIRLQVLELLQEEGELCVKEIVQALGVGQSKLSFHLDVLKKADYVQVRSQGRYKYYSINRDKFEDMVDFLSRFE